MRIAEHRHIRRDQRLLKRERAAYRRALRDILKLTDILKDVGRRALAEIVDASLTTGRVDLTNFTKTLSGARGGSSATNCRWTCLAPPPTPTCQACPW
ncbi:hypothetical protein [Nocardioides daphniae]|uniref:Uncharacterized protein n=1 Tax=Nocardioides daphniae TaxID=402297 RepID=A0A4P7UCB2_9ACTN|nr:hypothetical protein [Nocardioides daphniae]QCC77404.1 hypothetical protein E2C04_09810 [Nocardioides daphniae]